MGSGVKICIHDLLCSCVLRGWKKNTQCWIYHKMFYHKGIIPNKKFTCSQARLQKFYSQRATFYTYSRHCSAKFWTSLHMTILCANFPCSDATGYDLNLGV
jgi:hypothetical protein